MNPFSKRKKFLDTLASFKGQKQTKNQIDVPENLFIQCPSCHKSVPKSTIVENHYGCTNCDHLFFMPVYRRLNDVFDEGRYHEINKNYTVKNPLQFPDYEQKQQAIRKKENIKESVVSAIGKIGGIKTVVCVMDTRYLMGSMGVACGHKITMAVEHATRMKLPIIIFCASGGARMQEGALSLFQMAKTAGALKLHSDAGLLYVSVITNPTTGGVTASFASLGDLIISEPNALLGFAGPRVIEQTIKEKLPEGAQRAQYVLEHGFIDCIVKRNEMKTVLSKILQNCKGE